MCIFLCKSFLVQPLDWFLHQRIVSTRSCLLKPENAGLFQQKVSYSKHQKNLLGGPLGISQRKSPEIVLVQPAISLCSSTCSSGASHPADAAGTNALTGAIWWKWVVHRLKHPPPGPPRALCRSRVTTIDCKIYHKPQYIVSSKTNLHTSGVDGIPPDGLCQSPFKL